MLDRFSGTKGIPTLIDALLQQQVVAGDHTVAQKLAEVGKLVEFQIGDTIVEQDSDDDDVFFIINGRANVLVNTQCVATREGGTVVGEMVVIDPSARRSATLKAATIITALKVSADAFKEAGDTSTLFWKQLAQLLGNRLRERSKFHLPINQTPIMFVASSVEGLSIAHEVGALLKHDPVIVRLWSCGVFGPSRFPIEDLIKQVDDADFALFVFGPDDMISCREEEHQTPRDNVIFEMGLFIGRLGRDRVFMVKDADVDLKIPTDLLGLTPLTYKRKPGGTISDAVSTVCTELRKQISSKGAITHRLRA